MWEEDRHEKVGGPLEALRFLSFASAASATNIIVDVFIWLDATLNVINCAALSHEHAQ